jgi:hypothetical protein
MKVRCHRGIPEVGAAAGAASRTCPRASCDAIRGAWQRHAGSVALKSPALQVSAVSMMLSSEVWEHVRRCGRYDALFTVS